MSDECDKSGERLLWDVDQTEARLEVALAALNLALMNLSILGYEVPDKLYFSKKDVDLLRNRPVP